MRILPMCSAHIEAVLQIERATGLTPWDVPDYQRILEQTQTWSAVVATADRQPQAEYVVGFAAAMLIPPEMELSKIGIHPDWQGQGIARRVLEAILTNAWMRYCDTCFLEVRASNKRALALYDRYGFVIRGRRLNYYQNPDEDALILAGRVSPGVMASQRIV